MQQRNHRISRQIVDASPHSLIGWDDWTHSRERRKRTHGKRAIPKQRRAYRQASQWGFAELQGSIADKALLAGSLAVKVDADQTSQACPRCGHAAEGNRLHKGLLFSCQVCQVCQVVLHADLVGARNVALRTLLARKTGCARASCQHALRCQARRPKRHGGDALRRCGGAWMQAPALEPGVSDIGVRSVWRSPAAPTRITFSACSAQ